ncbi:MAG: biotin--[acetyl-CoA-carboxylase] ligase [Elusimicrobia bacterium]|nr:biotin--[acetyl-CoA-carboxylase] ligase [Elusimicrobiota bacterium]
MNKDFLLFKFDKVSSTQDLAKILSKDTDYEFAVSAKTQSGGYGRRKTKWFSPPGGIYLTLCLKRNISPADLPKISVKTAFAVKEYLDSLAIKSEIKHPNDIMAYINKEKRKICGILCETSKENGIYRIFVGVGLNLNNKAPKRCTAVSVFEILKTKTDEEEAEKSLISLIRKAF